MVRIAVAGGTGNVAQEIIDALVAAGKHDILILSRKGALASTDTRKGPSYEKTDYSSVPELATILRGYHTVLSFIAPYLDQEEAYLAQKNLIDASIEAGVKRFAPSEWVSSGLKYMPWYDFKVQTRQYLESVNGEKAALEYCLFQPGLFTNYLTHPHRSATHLAMIETPFDFGGRRMIAPEGSGAGKVTFTTVHDLANVVAQAVEFEGEWPVVGGIKGSDLSIEQLHALGEELRGPIALDLVKVGQLQIGEWTSSWLPKIEHPSIAPEHLETASKTVTAGILLAMHAGEFESDDTWNKLLPNYKIESAEGFLRRAWEGK